MERLLCLIIGYAWGCFLTGELVARCRTGESARRLGTGNPGMAKGGSGDVLSGMIAALWGQKHLKGPYTDPSELAAWAVWYHGKAGDKCARKLGEYGMLPSDLLDAIPEVLLENTDRG